MCYNISETMRIKYRSRASFKTNTGELLDIERKVSDATGGREEILREHWGI